MSLSYGRPYLAIPGPSVIPDPVLQAIHRASPNIYEGELHDLTRSLIPDLKSVAPDGCKKNVFAALIHEPDAACYLNNYELVGENGWDDLIQLTKTLAQNPGKIDRILNVDQALWMLAFNNVLVNLSSYSGRQSQNYYLYQDQIAVCVGHRAAGVQICPKHYRSFDGRV